MTDNLNATQLPSYRDLGTLKITQLDPAYKHPFGQTCWRGAQICKLEQMAGGKLYTSPRLGGMILTEQVLTPQELENPDFKSNLAPQTYNIIVKEITTGEIKSETIYKP